MKRFCGCSSLGDGTGTECAAHEEQRLALEKAESDIEKAFKAGYHCQWRKGKGYYFDPAMSPGDPDGAYKAWLAQSEGKDE